MIRKFQADYLEEKRKEFEEKKNKKNKNKNKEEKPAEVIAKFDLFYLIYSNNCLEVLINCTYTYTFSASLLISKY